MVSPANSRVTLLYHSRKRTEKLRSPLTVSAIHLPASMVSQRANSSARRRSMLAVAARIFPRSSPGMADHAGNAFSAHSTARLTSSTPALATRAITSPLAGLVDSKVAPLRASQYSPSIKSLISCTVILRPFQRSTRLYQVGCACSMSGSLLTITDLGAANDHGICGSGLLALA